VIVNAGALPYLLQLLSPLNKKGIRKEACWTISNVMVRLHACQAKQIHASNCILNYRLETKSKSKPCWMPT
jgi:hypothetical protein